MKTIIDMISEDENVNKDFKKSIKPEMEVKMNLAEQIEGILEDEFIMVEGVKLDHKDVMFSDVAEAIAGRLEIDREKTKEIIGNWYAKNITASFRPNIYLKDDVIAFKAGAHSLPLIKAITKDIIKIKDR